jgi:Tfp pilus assembly pilus retraction ATPase PilT
VLFSNARIQDLIRENRADEIPEAIAEGEFFQMQNFTQALIQLVIAGKVDKSGEGDDRAVPLREGVAPTQPTQPTLRLAGSS